MCDTRTSIFCAADTQERFMMSERSELGIGRVQFGGDGVRAVTLRRCMVCSTSTNLSAR